MEQQIVLDSSQASLSLLTGDLGRLVFAEYCKIVDEKFKKKEPLLWDFPGGDRYDLMINEDDGTIEGCGPFSMCLVEDILMKHGFRTANLFDYTHSVNLDKQVAEGLRGKHLNLGLLLKANRALDLRIEERYHEGDKHLKKRLREQLQAIGYPLSPPVYIPFSSVTLELDDNSKYGIYFKLKENPFLLSSASFKGKDRHISTGTGIFHIHYPKKQGLHMFRFFHNTSVSLDWAVDNLKGDDWLKSHHSLSICEFDKMSGSYGRILIVPASQSSYSSSPQ